MWNLYYLFIYFAVFLRETDSLYQRTSPEQKIFYSSANVPDDLMQASYIADVELVEELLSLDPDVIGSRPPVFINRVDVQHNRTSLIVCGLDPQTDMKEVDRNCLKIAKMLYKVGADLHHRDKYGWDALAMGAIRGLTKFCQFLIEKYVSIDSLDEHGRTPLMKAISHAHSGTMKMLIAKGANLSLQDSSGHTALHHALLLALRNESYVPFFQEVLRFHPKGDEFVDFDSRTVLMYATIDSNEVLVQTLLNHGCDPGRLDKFGVSAVQMSRDPKVQELFRNHSISQIERKHQKWLTQVQLDGS